MELKKKLKVALGQINTCVGAFTDNRARLLAFTKKAKDEGVDLIIFPELALSSYPPLDLLDRRDFCDFNSRELDLFLKDLAQLANAPAVIVGSIISNPSPAGRALQNAALTIVQGKVVHTQVKQLLPTYNVFDENRYYESGLGGPMWSSPWGNVGISVCEDAWYGDLHHGRHIYSRPDPTLNLKGCRFAVNTSASPFERGKQERRDKVLADFCQKLGAPLLYVNQVGSNDEIIFDGNSRVMDHKGNVVLTAPSFVEGLLVFDFIPETAGVSGAAFFKPQTKVLSEIPTNGGWSDESNLLSPQKPVAELQLLRQALVCGIADYFHKSGFSKAVIGLSGGIDSALVAVLAAEALGPANVIGVSMPSKFSSVHSLTDAQALAQNLQLRYGAASIKFIHSATLMELKHLFEGLPADITEENVQARLRGVILMALANKHKALVITTGNKSEIAVGYCTIYGDMCGALAPLGDVYKTSVYALSKYINKDREIIPFSTIQKPPSAELRPGQTDQDSLPPYDVLDAILERYVEGGQGLEEITGQGFTKDLVQRILDLVRVSEYKRRQAAPVLRVTTKAFGMGRRIPVVKCF